MLQLKYDSKTGFEDRGLNQYVLTTKVGVVCQCVAGSVDLNMKTGLIFPQGQD